MTNDILNLNWEVSQDEISKHYGYVYQTTCLVNNKKYIGIHIPTIPSYKYLGSSPSLKKDIAQYGRDKFSQVILAFAESADELAHLEIDFIHKFNACEDPQYYNMRRSTTIKTADLKAYQREKESLRTNKKEEKIIDTSNPNYGNYWSEEKKQQLRDKLRKQGHSQGKNNPNYDPKQKKERKIS